MQKTGEHSTCCRRVGAHHGVATILGGCHPQHKEVGVLSSEVIHNLLVSCSWGVVCLINHQQTNLLGTEPVLSGAASATQCLHRGQDNMRVAVGPVLCAFNLCNTQMGLAW